MADENEINASKLSAQAEAVNKAFAKTADSILDAGKELRNFTGDANKELSLIEKKLPKVAKAFADVKKQIKPVVSIIEDFGDSFKDATKHAGEMDKAIDKAVGGNQKQFLGALLQMRKFSGAVKDNAHQAMVLAQRMDDSSQAIKSAEAMMVKHTDALKDNKDQLKQNAEKMKILKEAIAQGGETADKARAEMNKLLSTAMTIRKEGVRTKEALVAENKARTVATQNMKQQALALNEVNKSQLQLKEQHIATIKEERRLNNETAIMNGGLEGMAGHAKKFKDEKLFEYLEKWGGGALIVSGLKSMNDALAKSSEMMLANSSIALTLGKDTKTAMGDLWSSTKRAQEATSEMMYLSGDLGLAFDEVSEAASRVRTSIRFDGAGAFGEKQIASMTRAAAEFSKVAGVDMETSVGMIEKRIKSFGMSSEDAVADINSMRIALKQMMTGVKSEVIAMDDMVKIIEDASEASKGGVVDMRLYTQALRGAATQAARLGDTQKQAKDLTEAVAKVMGDAPDFIKIPAGYDLLSQLTGDDPNGFLEQFDEHTQSQLKEIQTALKKGEIDKYTAARAVMDATAQTEAGQEATMKRLAKTVLGSTAAAEIIAQTYGIENRNTAFQLQKILRDTDKFKTELEKETGQKISFASAMAKDVVVFDEMVKGMNDAGKSVEEQVQALMDKGLSKTDATEYLKKIKAATDYKLDQEEKLAALEGDNSEAAAKERAAIEKDIYKHTVLEQAKFLDNAMHPAKKLLNGLRDQIKDKKIELGTKLNAKDFIAGGIKNAKALAKEMGITGDKNIAELEKVYSGHRTITANQLEDMRKNESEANKKQIESITATATKFNEGLLTGLKYVSTSMIGGMRDWLHEKGILDQKYMNLFGPVTEALVGLGAAAAGLVLMWKGAYRLISGAVEAGVRAAGGTGNGNSPDGPDVPEKTKSRGGTTRASARTRIMDGVKNLRTKGGWKNLAGGFKDLGKGALQTIGDDAKSALNFKGATKLAKFGKGLGIAGAVYGAYNYGKDMINIKNDDKLTDKEKTQKYTSKTAGTLGGLGGAYVGGKAGALAGGAVGAMFGGVGAAPGALIGGAVGAGVGYFAGESALESITEYFQDKKKDDDGKTANVALAASTATKDVIGEQMKKPQIAPSTGGGASGAVSGTGGSSGSPGSIPSLQANANQQSFNASNGKLSLEIGNFGDVWAALQNAASFFRF